MANLQNLSRKELGKGEAPLTDRPLVKPKNARQSDAKSPSGPVDLSSVAFDPHAPELTRSWSTFASTVYCVNAYPNGITFSSHENAPVAEDNGGDEAGQSKYLPNQFHLRFADTRDFMLPAGKYFLFKDHFREGLERRLAQLHERGLLASSVFYLGMITDAFLSFHKKFDVTMACLDLLEQYRPGFIVVQTRSPMVISALPTLKLFGDRAVVSIPIETRLETAIARYTPGLPKLSERLVAADGLRKQGVKVNLMASPILPYGDVYRDAWDFADLLDKHADYITVGCLAGGKPGEEHQLKGLPVAQKLVADKNYRWLRPHAYRNLYYALKVLAPEKLLLPSVVKSNPAQLDMFAA